MVSFTPVVLLVLSAISTISSVHASPIGKRDVPISNCTAITATGILRSTNGQTMHISNRLLEYGGSQEFEFRSCQPNFGGFDGKHGIPIGGHIYDPRTKKCLSAKPASTGSSGGPPFVFELQSCYVSDDSGQVFSNFALQRDGKIYYVGLTQADGSNPWIPACKSGYFGVSSRATHGPVQFSCVNDGHIIGLNI